MSDMLTSELEPDRFISQYEIIAFNLHRPFVTADIGLLKKKQKVRAFTHVMDVA